MEAKTGKEFQIHIPITTNKKHNHYVFINFLEKLIYGVN